MIALLATLALTLAQDAPADETPADEAVEEVTTDTGAAAAGPEPEPPPLPHPEFPNAPSYPNQVTQDSPHYDLEVLYSKQKHDEGLRLAKQRLAADPNDTTLAWMIVRFTFEKFEEVERTDKSVDKLAVYTELVEIVDHALTVAPGDPHLLFAKGLAMGRLGTTRGVLASLFMADDIERAWLASIKSDFGYASIMGAERLPCDTKLALAVFYRLVPDWWIVKVLSGTRGDLDKAVSYAEQANRCHPGVHRNLKQLGVAKLCQGHKTGDDAMIEEGRGHIRKMMSIPPTIKTSKIDIAHGQKLLDRAPKDACEYSRDGWQDLDRSKLKQ